MQLQESQRENLAGEWLIFRAGSQEYGIRILQVQELRGYEPQLVTRVAFAPPAVLGLMNLRGQIIPVVDLRLKIGADDNPTINAQTVIMILTLEGRMIGTVVDGVSDVLNLTADMIREPPKAQDIGSESRLCGLVEHDNRLIQLLDVAGLLGDSASQETHEMLVAQQNAS